MIDDDDEITGLNDRSFGKWFKGSIQKLPNPRLSSVLRPMSLNKWIDDNFEIPENLPELPINFLIDNRIPKNTIIAFDPGSKDSHGIFKFDGENIRPMACPCPHCQARRQENFCQHVDLPRKERCKEWKDKKPMSDLAIKTLESKLSDLESSLKNERNILTQIQERLEETKNKIKKIQAACEDVSTSLNILCAVHSREVALNEPPEASLPDGSLDGVDI